MLVHFIRKDISLAIAGMKAPETAWHRPHNIQSHQHHSNHKTFASWNIFISRTISTLFCFT